MKSTLFKKKMKKHKKIIFLILQGYRPKTMSIWGGFLGKLALNFCVFHGSVVGKMFFVIFEKILEIGVAL